MEIRLTYKISGENDHPLLRAFQLIESSELDPLELVLRNGRRELLDQFRTPDTERFLSENLSRGEYTMEERTRLVMTILRMLCSYPCVESSHLSLLGNSITDFGAGSGYISALLRAKGAVVYSYEPNPVESGHRWTETSEERPNGSESETLLFSWPIPSEEFYSALRRHKGARVAYIGPDWHLPNSASRYFGIPMFFATLEAQYRRVHTLEPLYPSLPNERIILFER